MKRRQRHSSAVASGLRVRCIRPSAGHKARTRWMGRQPPRSIAAKGTWSRGNGAVTRWHLDGPWKRALRRRRDFRRCGRERSLDGRNRRPVDGIPGRRRWHGRRRRYGRYRSHQWIRRCPARNGARWQRRAFERRVDALAGSPRDHRAGCPGRSDSGRSEYGPRCAGASPGLIPLGVVAEFDGGRALARCPMHG